MNDIDLKDVVFYNDCAYFPDLDVATVSDLHVGLEEEVRHGGMSMPLDEKDRLEDRLRDVLIETRPTEIVFNGDVHHEFGNLGSAGHTIQRFAQIAQDEGADPVFVEGNHDTMLSSVVQTHEWYESDGVVFVHGHELPVNLPEADLYVVGHDHPAVEIEMQKHRCYLYGPYGEEKVLMTPAFNPLCRGVVINEMGSHDFMSPFVKDSIEEFRLALEKEKGKVLRFPRIRDFREML